MRSNPSGFSFIELMIGIGLSFLIMAGAYKLMGTVSVKTTREMRNTQTNVTATKWIDRMTMQMANAIDFPRATGTLFGNMPKTIDPGIPTNCSALMLSEYTGSAFIPHGIVPLPQQSMSDLDQGDYLTVMDPSYPGPDGGAGIDNVAYDAVRIAYFPDGSNPIAITNNVLKGTGYTNIPLSASDITKFSVGDYAVIFNRTTRELFRVTAITGAYELRHLTTSFWNAKFLQDFSSSGTFVQKVQLITYAFDKDTNEVVFDDHIHDDGFNPATKAFSSPGIRTLNWMVIAPNVNSFKIYYSYSSSAVGTTSTAETRKPAATLPDSYKDSNCHNEVGYPYFRNVRFEITMTPTSGSTTADTITLSRSITPELMRRDSLTTDVTNKDPVTIVGSATPTPPPPSGTQYLGNGSGGF